MKIIAEAGLNWQSFNEAVEYAEKAKEIGADIIKYQWIKDDSLPSHKCHMNKGEWKALKGYCDKIGIEFICTPSSKEILGDLLTIGIKSIKIGSDHVKDIPLTDGHKEHFKCLVSDGYYEGGNMYCVSLYPCDKKFIDFDKMANGKYIGFSDHTLEYNKEWCDKIKACSNIQYVEKHFTLTSNTIDANVSLNMKEMQQFISNLK